PAEMPFAKLSLQRLRLHLHGDNALVSIMYELIFNHTLQVAFRFPDVKPAKPPIVLEPEQCLSPVGFEPGEGLLPYPRQSVLRYRLLAEFFGFPSKYLFVDLGGWDQLKPAGVGRQVEVVLLFNRTLNRLEQTLDAGMFRLGCTPVINLFEHTCEPIPLTHLKPDYKMVPEVSQPGGYEVYSVESVTAASPAGDREYRSFYSFRHGGDRNKP